MTTRWAQTGNFSDRRWGGSADRGQWSVMPRRYTRDEVVERLIRAGELEVSGEDQDEAGTYFDTENFAFHGPAGFDADYAGRSEHCRPPRAALAAPRSSRRTKTR